MAGHILKAFDEDLESLKESLSNMADFLYIQIEKTFELLDDCSQEKADIIINNDDVIDSYQREINYKVEHLIALRHPVAGDLRYVLGAFEVARYLERIGDHVENIARRIALKIKDKDFLEYIKPSLGRLQHDAHLLFGRCMKAYLDIDLESLSSYFMDERNIDEAYVGILSLIFDYMVKNPQTIHNTSQVLFLVKSVERIADLSINILRTLIFVKTAVRDISDNDI